MSALSQLLSIPVSGLQASQTRAQAAANNIANVQTPDYKTTEVTATSLVSNPNSAGGAGVQAVLSQGGNVDLATELVNLKQAEIAYKANAKVLASLDKTIKQVFDELA